VVVFPNFIDEERSSAIIAMALGRLGPSGLALKPGETGESVKDVRTSQGTFLTSRGDPSGVLKWIEERIAQVTGIPASHGEVREG